MVSDGVVIDGLLRRRGELRAEIERTTARCEELSVQIAEFDRQLDAFGFDEDLEGRRSRKARIVRFHNNELGFVLVEMLKQSKRPKTARALAKLLANVDGSRREDRYFLIVFTARVRAALKVLLRNGVVEMYEPTKGTPYWHLRANPDRN